MKKNRIITALILLVFSGLFSYFIFSNTEYENEIERALLLKNSSKNNVFDGVEEPPMPDRTENDKTLLGVDSNKNNLRDDVEIWINRTAKNYNQRLGMKQAASNLEYKIIAADKNERDIMIHAENVSYTDFPCLVFIFEGRLSESLIIRETLNTMVFNTRKRLEILERFNFPHSYESIVKNGGINKPYLSCFFSIENKEMTIKNYFINIKK